MDKRVTASQALAHPFFEPFRDPEEETEAQKFDDSLEHEKLTVDEWKRKSRGRAPSSLPQPLCPWPLFPCLASLAAPPGDHASAPLLPHCLLRAFPPPWADSAPCCVCGRAGLFPPSAPYPPGHPAFLRAHLQGDRELQPHCPEGLAAPEWHEAVVKGPADLAEPGTTTQTPPASARDQCSPVTAEGFVGFSLPSRGQRALSLE